jgi:hypothetical protein
MISWKDEQGLEVPLRAKKTRHKSNSTDEILYSGAYTMSTETGGTNIRKVVRVTTCNTGKAKAAFDELVSHGTEFNGWQILVDPLKNEEKNDRYTISCRICGQDEQKVNEECKALGELMLAFCISKGVGCSSIRFTNETGSFVEGRRWAQCQYAFRDEEEQLGIT